MFGLLWLGFLINLVFVEVVSNVFFCVGSSLVVVIIVKEKVLEFWSCFRKLGFLLVFRILNLEVYERVFEMVVYLEVRVMFMVV